MYYEKFEKTGTYLHVCVTKWLFNLSKMFLMILILAHWIEFTFMYNLIFISKVSVIKALVHSGFLVIGKQYTAFTSL